jgi:hypothetical protein
LKSFNQDNIIEETNNQNSISKIYIDGFSNLAGNLSNIKYSFSIGGTWNYSHTLPIDK